MIETELVMDPTDLAAISVCRGITRPGSAGPALQGADAHVRVADAEAAAASCSLWWTQAPKLRGETVGVIGHYSASDPAAAAAVLERACAELAGQGCAIAVGPMDGSTWRRCRCLTDRGPESPFFLEPDNPPEWPAQFYWAQFRELETYYSALCTDLDYVDPRLDRVAPRIERAGITIRSINTGQFDAELAAIHRVSLVSFRNNVLYSPISEAEFLEQYRPLLPLLRPELVLLAEQRGELVGFLFAVPDLLQAKRGGTIDTAIVKTVAVLPGREYAGLGNLLVAKSHIIAARLGYRRAIHALMHESNESRALSGHYGRPFRRYALYSRCLTGG